jgi:homocysteine S-methyltransferase
MVSTNNPLASALAGRPCLILDGALATELERRGADLNDPLWSARLLIEAPELIRQVHYDYFVAGADVAITASYQASAEGFARRGVAIERATQLWQQSVRLAQAAREEFLSHAAMTGQRLRPLVAASIGPYGAALADGSEYRGNYQLDDAALSAFHRPRLAALLAAGPDLLACETLPSLREALVLARLLREFPSGVAWMSFACQDGRRTCEGQDVGECARALQDFPQVIAVGINCTAPLHVPALLRQLRSHTGKILLAYPNSGRWHRCASDALPLTGVGFASQACGWYRAGARLIGGCCGTTPEDISDMRENLAACA